MTAYTIIADSELDPESPITTTLATKWRDNPIAIVEKAAGAPQLADGYIEQKMMANSTSLATHYNYVNQVEIFTIADITSYTKVAEIKVSRDGEISATFDLKSASTTDAFGRIYVNGIAVGTIRNNPTTTYITYAEDINVSRGDLVQLYLRVGTTPRTVIATKFGVGFNEFSDIARA